MKGNILVKVIESINFYLNNSERKYSLLLLLLLLIGAVLDVFGLASIVPVIMAASTPEIIHTNRFFNFIYTSLNFQSEKAFLTFLILGVLMFFLFKNLFITWINYKQVKFTSQIALKIINKQFSKYSNLPYWIFSTEGSGKMANNVASVPLYYVSGIIRPTFVLFSEVVMILVIVLGILFYQPLLFLILTVVLTPATILTYQLLKKRSAAIGAKLNSLRPISHNIIYNTFNGFIELKLANRIDMFKDRFVSIQNEAQELEAKSYLLSLIPVKVIEMVAILGVVTIFLFSLFFTDSSGQLITIIGLFAAAAYRLMPSVNRLLTSLVSLKGAEIAITELSTYNEFNKAEIAKQDITPIKFKDAITFNNISFAFPGSDKMTLNNINIKIKKGQKIGFIGASGSGKTTLMNLLLRFYIESEGEILIDGVPLNEENKLSWYKLVSYVKQETFLMDASILENITLGDPEVDAGRLSYAIEQASLMDFIISLPEGVKTFIGERGSKLSGGQKQRIGIARALYKNTQVLVLDEATSALDSNTEREVSEAIDKLANTDITIFIIAHRITTLRDCDRIFEMKAGKIISERSYEEVIKDVI